MASAAVLQIEQTIVKLPSTDQEFLYRRLERVLKLASSRKVGSDFRKKRFAADLKCPRCGNTRLHRHGKYRGWRRYKCLSCTKTFNMRPLPRWLGPTTASRSGSSTPSA